MLRCYKRMSKEKNEILGRGLSALISDDVSFTEEEAKEHNLIYIKINSIDPNPYQPRANISLASIVELSNSIKTQGLILPITVTKSKTKDNRYVLVAGERRLKASKMAGMKEIPALLTDVDELGLAEISLIENVHRKDLNPMEEAYAIYNLIGEFDQTIDQIAYKLSKTKDYVRTKLMLVKLPNVVQDAVSSGEISERHAIALYKLQSEEAIIATLKIIIRNKLSVEASLKLINDIQNEKKIGKTNISGNKIWLNKFSFVKEDLSNLLGFNIKLKKKSRDKGGSVIIEFQDDNHLLELHKKIVG